ncbi:MAG: ubiquitin-like small modifier protein 1 [Candidatus Dormibacteria bacterium]
MTVKVRVPGPLRRLTGGEAVVEVEGATVGEALTDLDRRHPGFRDRLYDEQGNLRQFINVFHNDQDVRFGEGLDTQLGDSDSVSIVPAVAGGAGPVA